MHRVTSLLTVVLSTALAAAEQRQLFNGKDLSGWEGNPANWSVRDGCITGVNTEADPLPYNQFLTWQGGAVKNFELRAKVRQSGNNSGIQYRSKPLKDVGPWAVGGYQCDIHGSKVSSSGMLYDEKGRGILAENGQKVVIDEQGVRWLTTEREPVVVDVGEWNEYTILAEGNRLTHKVNGKVTVEVVDHQADERELEGLLAFQIHRGPAMTVQIKDVVLKELPDGGVITAAQAPVPAGAKKLEESRRPGRRGNRAPETRAAAEPVARPARRPPGPIQAEATGRVEGENRATPVERIKVAKGFKVELLCAVPAQEQGSWVNLCVDGKGRIIVSDQFGGLWRFPAPPAGKALDPATIEKVPADIRAVNGMVWAFGALYVGVNDYEKKFPGGLYRVTDPDGDDRLDRVEHLREMESVGDHGVHAVVPSPDGKSLFLVVGNRVDPTQYSSSRVPPVWGEDHLLPRLPDGRGFMRDKLAPGGIIYKVTKDGKDFEIYSAGYRNIFDAAFNRAGDLFTYDADMEYDFNTPWYRPTRVCHAVSGSEYGWRNGGGKRPTFYPDNLPPVIDIGPGSPTGVTFGYGAKFPAKYQEAFFALDWSWGKLYAIHMVPSGATYTATKEEFISGSPLPLTDAIIHPGDGAMYFAIGGRKVQSGLYRVTYAGDEPTAPVTGEVRVSEEHALRRRLESFHGRVDPKAVDESWPHLGHPDRFVRWAARTAIEHQPAETWASQALSEKDPGKQLEALMGLVRVTGIDPQHRKPSDPPVDKAMQANVLDALAKTDWDRLTHDQRITFVRTYQICLARFGRPDDAAVDRIIAQLDPRFPAPPRELNWLLCEALVYLQSPTVAAKAVALIEAAPTQEEQMEYARSLRMLKTGWTTATRTAYFRWFLKAANYRGGASFEKFLEFIRNDALATLSDEEKTALRDVLAETPIRKKSPVEEMATAFAGRTVKEWTLDELAAGTEAGLKDRSFENGRKMFAAAACFTCHRFANEGGMTGPDLTGAGGRYSPRDLIDQILHPSKVINEQFVPVVIRRTKGAPLTGVIVNLKGDTVIINTDAADPNEQVSVDRKDVRSMEPSKVSPMPEGLLGLMTKEEVLDLVAYTLSGGDPKHHAFKR